MTPTRLSIVDTALGDLVVSLQDAGVHGVLLSGGPAEVGRHLAACGAVDVLELFCHGQAGALHLGAQRWDAEAVLRQAAAFRPWTGHLKPGAAIHLHACRAGAGEAGAALIYALASVTGATVCAASHDLGRSDDGSEHWQLDRQAGQPGPHQPRSLAGVAGRLVILSGTAGDDSLVGGATADEFFGSLGHDTIVGDLGADTLTADWDLSGLPDDGASLGYNIGGVALTSTASFTLVARAVNDLARGLSLQIGTSTGSFSTLASGIENWHIDLTGTAHDDLLILQGGTRYLGGAGTDTLYASWTTDSLGISWTNDPGQEQVVAGVTIAGIERMLVQTGSGNDLVANDYAGSTSTDYIDTGAGNDTLRGGGGNDTLIAGDGDDLVVTGTGNNTISLGLGNDRLQTDGLGIDFVDGGLGLDRIEGLIDYSGLAGTGQGIVYSFVSALGTVTFNSSFAAINTQLSFGIVSASFGNSSVLSFNRITTSGVEVIATDFIGSARDDLLVRLDGSSYRGGAGTDTFYDDLWFTTDAVSFVNTTDTDLLIGGVTVSSVERLLLRTGSGNDLIDNTAVVATADYIDTGSGNDTIDAGSGNDIIVAGLGDDLVTTHAGNNLVLLGAGNDSVTGSQGLDTLDGGAGLDTLELELDFSGANLSAGLQFGNSTALLFDAGITLTSILDTVPAAPTQFFIGRNLQSGTLASGFETIHASVIGSALDDLIVLLGGTHYDGGAGSDTFHADWSAALGPVTWVNGTGSAVTVEGVQLAGMERLLLLTGAGDDLVDNSAVTVATRDELQTGAGNDTLVGGLGVDTLVGGTGDDSYGVDAATDLVIEQLDEGIDTLLASYAATLVDNVENLVLQGTASLAGSGNALANVLTGNAGDNLLDGAAGDDTLAGGDGNDTLVGGLGLDSLVGGTGDDLYRLTGDGDVVLEDVDGGIDSVESSGSYGLTTAVEHLTLTGTLDIDAAGNDADNRLTGNGGANHLDAGAGNDTLSGGAGNDTMAGGSGDDLYVVDAPGDVVVELADQGTDTVSSSVSLVLAGQVEHLLLGGTADLAGTGNDLANSLTGNAGHNLLVGDGGADTLSGGDGNDTLAGGLGLDSLVGGAGDDSYRLAGEADSVVEALDGGVDTVETSATHVLAANVENLVLTGTANVNGTGNALANVLTGNAGANSLSGGAGADTMSGGDGSDTYDVDNALDVVSETNALAAGGLDQVNSRLAAYTLGANVENGRILATGTASLTGNTLANTLLAGAGANTLDGGAGLDTVSYAFATAAVSVSLAITTAQATGGSGSDTLVGIENLTGSNFADTLGGNAGANTLIGGLGADTMSGGDGNDSYTVDNIGDSVVETNALAAGGVDRVNSTLAAYTLGANVEEGRITAAGAANLTGNTLANTLFAGAGGNVLDGGAGLDTVSYAFATAAVTASLGLTTPQATGGSGLDSFVSIENLTGSNYADTLAGNAAANLLNGGVGADTMSGGDGSDTYTVDNALDLVVETNAVATTGGTDLVNVSLANYTLGANVENGRITATGAATLTGNTLANTLYAGAGANKLDGGAGVDTVSYQYAGAAVRVSLASQGLAQATGGSGSDTLLGIERLVGSNFADTLAGDAGANVLNGGAGNDALDAAAGNDVLTGGLGQDTLTGGAGLDNFRFDTALGATNVDAVADFVVADDTIQLENAIFTALTTTGTLGAGSLRAGAGVTSAADADDFVLYDATTGALYYDADGSGLAVGAVQFARMGAGLLVTSADFVVS